MLKLPLNRILITGANGGIGRMLRKNCTRMAKQLRLTDRDAGLGAAGEGEEIMTGDLSDAGFALAVTADVDAVFHFGGKSVEGTFEEILNANIIGAYNVFEGCRKNAVRRMVFAGSNHAVGFHPRTRVLQTDAPTRPDSNYGVSKVYGEALAQLYWDKYGLETVSVRIGSCLPEPRDLRMLATWQSPADMVRLLECCLRALSVGHTIVYGVSDNLEKIWDNRGAGNLGYRPLDSSEKFRKKLEEREPPHARSDAVYTRHGGAFVSAPHFEDPPLDKA